MKRQISFKHIPFLRLLIPFMIGICLIFFIQIELFYSLVFQILTLLIISFLLALPLIFATSKGVSGILTGLAFFLLGMLATSLSLSHKKLPIEKTDYCGVILSNPVIKSKTIRCECILTRFKNDHCQGIISEKAEFYYIPDSSKAVPEIGDSVFISAAFTSDNRKLNPGEFNYSKYLVIQGIRYSTFLKDNDIQFGNNSGKFPIRRVAGSVQREIQESFRQHSMKGAELAVLTALFAGDRSLLDTETMNSYMIAGAVHILSVSGMHVGILFIIFSLILGKGKRKIGFVLFRITILILIIWFYAFITGLSPSVVRASLMFTLFAIGKGFERQINSYNILSASAFLILFFNPLTIFMVGFQLSYLAVLGIIYFQPRIAGILQFESKIADWIWQLTTVGIAAQLTTFPLTIFYFHQFPVYFWLTNLLIIPLVWLIMVGTILFFVFMPFSLLAGWMAGIVSGIVLLLNRIIDYISHMPGAVISDIRFNVIHLLLFSLLIIIGLTIYYFGRKKYMILFALSVFSILIIFNTVNYYINDKKNEVIIYNINKGTAVSFIGGHKHILLVNSDAIQNNYRSLERQLKNYWINREIYTDRLIINMDTIHSNQMLKINHALICRTMHGVEFQINQKRYLIPTELNDSINAPGDSFERRNFKISVPYINIGSIEQSSYHSIIINHSVSPVSRRTWKQLADNMQIEYYDVTVSGPLFIGKEN